jgi:hypothetical protein
VRARLVGFFKIKGWGARHYVVLAAFVISIKLTLRALGVGGPVSGVLSFWSAFAIACLIEVRLNKTVHIEHLSVIACLSCKRCYLEDDGKDVPAEGPPSPEAKP